MDTHQWPPRPRGKVFLRGSACKPSHPKQLQSNTLTGLMVALREILLRSQSRLPKRIHAPQHWSWWSVPLLGREVTYSKSNSIRRSANFCLGNTVAENNQKCWMKHEKCLPENTDELARQKGIRSKRKERQQSREGKNTRVLLVL